MTNDEEMKGFRFRVSGRKGIERSTWGIEHRAESEGHRAESEGHGAERIGQRAKGIGIGAGDSRLREILWVVEIRRMRRNK